MTLNGIYMYYASLLRQLRESITVKNQERLSKGLLFHQYNTPIHTSVTAMAALSNGGFELLQPPPYSPDLTPSDFHLFP